MLTIWVAVEFIRTSRLALYFDFFTSDNLYVIYLRGNLSYCRMLTISIYKKVSLVAGYGKRSFIVPNYLKNRYAMRTCSAERTLKAI